jgi:excisionase family DNA binding protein
MIKLALFNCPDCKAQVSDQAYFCINCGYPFIEIQISKKARIDSKKPFDKMSDDTNLNKDTLNKYMNDPFVDKLSNTNVYTVGDIQKILSINKNKSYKLAMSGQFPAKKLGRRILIPAQAFLNWLNNNNQNSSLK